MKFILLIAVLAVSAACAQAALEPIRQVTVGKNAEFRVNGKPFLPIMVWLGDPRYFAAIKEAGINTLVGYAGGDRPGKMTAYGEEAWKSGFYFVGACDRGLSTEERAQLRTSPNLLGWIQGDEPDLASKARDGSSRKAPRMTTEEVMSAYQATRAFDSTHPIFMTLTAGFMHRDTTWSQSRKETMYPALARAADVLGFDTYPIFGSGTPAHLHDVADGVADLRALAGPHKPIYAWIESNKGSRWMTPSKQPDVTPADTRAEVWMAIIQGARAIGYFTHKWFDPDGTANYSSFAPTEEMRAEMKRLDAQLTRLAPAILADPARAKVEISMSGGLACHVKATELDGATYLFAQNIDLGEGAEKLGQFDPIHPRGGMGTITVEGLRAGTQIEVVDEGRTITAEAGRFTDEFGPLAEHTYRIAAGVRG